MLDVHPPHHAATSWRDFSIHIATICVGLLIAIALEQSVEAIHRAHQRHILEAALTHESEQILRDTTNVENGETVHIHWLQQYEAQVSAAARDKNPLPPIPQKSGGGGWDVPSDPIYAAAKSSAKLDLLADEDVIAYGEQDGLIVEVNAHYETYDQTRKALETAVRRISYAKPNPATPFDRATPAEMQDLYNKLLDYEQAARGFRFWSRQARGATVVMLQGERDLHKIQAAERQFDNVP
ncbi:MAG TPA: hypothetical protein VFC39_13220 [Acidobacteriaceae bacterium]|nr:hypothetical protein [Acidobacteriaceae bacterium]